MKHAVVRLCALAVLPALFHCGLASAAEGDQAAKNDGQQPLREWVDNSGRYRTVARLVERNDTHVWLKKSDGSVVEVTLNRLSTNDRDYVELLPAPPDIQHPTTRQERDLPDPIAAWAKRDLRFANGRVGFRNRIQIVKQSGPKVTIRIGGWTSPLTEEMYSLADYHHVRIYDYKNAENKQWLKVYPTLKSRSGWRYPSAMIRIGAEVQFDEVADLPRGWKMFHVVLHEEVDASEVTKNILEIQEPGSIRGRLVVGEQPVEGAVVRADDGSGPAPFSVNVTRQDLDKLHSTMTDRNGLFYFSELPPGDYRMIVERTARTYTQTLSSKFLMPGSELDYGTLDLR